MGRRRIAQISGNEIVQYLQFVRREIVLCNSNILRRGKIPGKCGKPHKWLFGIGSLKNHLCGGMAMGGIVQLVLHHFEKSHRLGAFGVIVHASSVEVEDLTVHHLFGGTDVPDAVKKLLPIAAAAEILQALIIHGEALDHVLLQALGSPAAELRCNGGPDAIAQRDDHVQVII